MCSLACSQNKGLSEYQRRASWLHTGSSTHRRQRGRWVTARAGRQGVAPILAPETSILCQTVSRPPVANHIFLGSWMVNICQEGCGLRSAPQRRHTAHLRRCYRCAPRKPSCRDGEMIKTHGPHGTVCSPSTWSPELLRPRKHTKHMPRGVCALEEDPRT